MKHRNDDYPSYCPASHMCYPHLETHPNGWCIEKKGHRGKPHLCGRCGDRFGTIHVLHSYVPEEVYTRMEVIGLLKLRVARYEKLVEEHEARKLFLTYAIDELRSLIAFFSSEE